MHDIFVICDCYIDMLDMYMSIDIILNFETCGIRVRDTGIMMFN